MVASLQYICIYFTPIPLILSSYNPFIALSPVHVGSDQSTCSVTALPPDEYEIFSLNLNLAGGGCKQLAFVSSINKSNQTYAIDTCYPHLLCCFLSAF